MKINISDTYITFNAETQTEACALGKVAAKTKEETHTYEGKVSLRIDALKLLAAAANP